MIRTAIIVASALVLTACASGPPTDPYNGPPAQQVFQVPGVNAEQLYEGSRQWIAENFKSAKSVIEYESRDTLTIIGNGRSADNVACLSFGVENLELDSTCMHPVSMEFTLKVEAKDGRMRLSVPNLSLYRAAYINSYNSGGDWSQPAGEVAYPVLSKRVLNYGDDIAAYVNGLGEDTF